MDKNTISTPEPGLEECPYTHEPNETTKKSIESIEQRKGLQKAESMEELFKNLTEL